MGSHYNHLNKKLDALRDKQWRKTRSGHNSQEQQFYLRTKKSNKHLIYQETSNKPGVVQMVASGLGSQISMTFGT
jgi:hypothetical protein